MIFTKFLDFGKLFVGVTVGILKGQNGSSSHVIDKIDAVGGGEESEVSFRKLFLTV